MFTGIVEGIGTVDTIEQRPPGARLRILAHELARDLGVGDSVSLNGCCVTVVDRTPEASTAELMGETLARTTLGELTPQAPVNLERPLPVGGRFGGHLVQGHVDGVGSVVDLREERAWTVMTCEFPAPLAPYVVEKGSIAVDGTSLTIMAVEPPAAGAVLPRFQVGLIPHTLAVTVLGWRRFGDRVNLEVDIVAKHVERLLQAGAATPYGG